MKFGLMKHMKKTIIMIKTEKKNLSATTNIVSVMVRPHTIMKKKESMRLKERKRVNKILSYDFFTNKNSEVNINE